MKQKADCVIARPDPRNLGLAKGDGDMKSECFDQTQKAKLLDGLVESGLDFLERAMNELKNSSKYSVIHFCTSVELFLKARLLAKDWRLVVDNQKNAEWSTLISGEFKSVTLTDPIKRLKKDVHCAIQENEIQTFKNLSDRRNKMIHFVHQVASSDEEKSTLVQEQCHAWHFLFEFLTKQELVTFQPWIKKIEGIDKKVKKRHIEYLKILFKQLRPRIKEMRGKGIQFSTCFYCGLTAQPQEHKAREEGKAYTLSCLVCEATQQYVQIQCLQCQNRVTCNSEERPNCTCGKTFELNEFEDILSSKTYHVWEKGYCANCQASVVRTKYDKYLCTQCLKEFDGLEQCQSCGRLNTSNMEHSERTGCDICYEEMLKTI